VETKGVAAALRDIVVKMVCKRGNYCVDCGSGKETMRGKDSETS
jgi:hypothetical protein